MSSSDPLLSCLQLAGCKSEGLENCCASLEDLKNCCASLEELMALDLDIIVPPSPPWDDDDTSFDEQQIDIKIEDVMAICPLGIKVEEDGEMRIKGNNFDGLSAFPSPESSANRDGSLESTIYQMSSQEQKEAIVNNDEMSHCTVCKLVFTDSGELKTHKDSFQKSLNCCQCGKKFQSITKLVCHHRKHSKEKPFQCGSCGKYYTHRTTLTRHQLHYCQTLRAKCEDGIQIFPSQDKEHLNILQQTTEECSDYEELSDKTQKICTRCRVCAKEFYDPETLKNHTNFHLKIRTCCLCQKVMGNKSKLLTHFRSHTKESPYSCTFCGKCFSETSTLRKHEATHGAKNFQCDICDKGFVRKDYLAKHMLTHRQTYKCAQCTFVCHTREDIELHVKNHP